nr:MAG TPA: helix-turn-helix domain protein [Caudoviricetes sp.]
MSYHKLLGQIRAAGMTQTELAEKIGISAVTLNKKLRGHSEFTQSEIRSICQILQIPGDEIASYFF